MAQMVSELSPVRIGFMWPRVAGAVVLCVFLSVGLSAGAIFIPFWPMFLAIPVVWLVVMALSVYAAHVAFTKERYEIFDEHLVCHRGTLLSDGQTELDIRNITHVRLRLPWLRYRLFKIGDVRVESAGSASSEITFQSITEPEEAYEKVQELMRANGFALTRSEVLHEESPRMIGALTDIVQTGFGAIFTIAWIIFATMGLGAGAAESAGALGAAFVSVLGIVVAAGSVVLAIGGLIVRYLDLTRRTYTVSNDAVTYTEGFLTRDNAFIPYENIADASTNRTFVDQVLGLYDVKVSCQGSGSEINFRRLSRGPELKDSISALVAKGGKIAPKKTAVTAGETSDDAAESVDSQEVAAAIKTRELVDPSDAWTAEFQMNIPRTLVPLLALLPTGPAWLIATIAMYIQASKTTYTVGGSSMSSSYKFIGEKQSEFAYDKVTGVQLTRNPLDNFFKTVTVQIWSIGSPMPLTMNNIALDDLNLDALLRQCGIDAGAEAEAELDQSFGPRVWLIQNAIGLVFLAIVCLALLILALWQSFWIALIIPLLLVLPVPMAILTAMRVSRQHITFHGEHVEAQTGVLIKQHIYARFDNIKKVETTTIPWTDQGTYKLYVAGERMVVQNQQQQEAAGGGVKMPYSLQGDYIESVTSLVDATDALMLGRISPSEILADHDGGEVLSESKPAVGNSVVPMLFFPPIWPFIPLVAWQVSVRRYHVEPDRVVARGGILFKHASSVLFNRIDSLQQDQGALGKAFGNGRVVLLTAGSSNPDLVVANVPDYGEVYDAIRARYGKG